MSVSGLLRLIVRVPLLALHILISLPATVLAINPIARRIRVGDGNLTQWMICCWSTVTCWIFGLKLKVAGQLVDGPVMLLANHVNWMDIEIIHSQRAVSFVAKAEIEKWPFVGWLASAGGSVYHQRGSSESQQTVVTDLASRLDQGQSVAVFPEGRTGPGDRVLPFHGRLLKAAVDAGCPLQPVALAFYRDGMLVNDQIAFFPGESFLGNLGRLLAAPGCDVVITFCPPLNPHASGRRELAHEARNQIVAVLDR